MQHQTTPRETFVFYRSFLKVLDFVAPEHQLAVLRAICEYGLDDKEPQRCADAALSNTIGTIFTFVRPLIDAALKRHETAIINGRKGGAPKGNTNAKKHADAPCAPAEEEDACKAPQIQEPVTQTAQKYAAQAKTVRKPAPQVKRMQELAEQVAAMQALIEQAMSIQELAAQVQAPQAPEYGQPPKQPKTTQNNQKTTGLFENNLNINTNNNINDYVNHQSSRAGAWELTCRRLIGEPTDEMIDDGSFYIEKGFTDRDVSKALEDAVEHSASFPWLYAKKVLDNRLAGDNARGIQARSPAYRKRFFERPQLEPDSVRIKREMLRELEEEEEEAAVSSFG